jgi:hypothetical protein
LLKPTSVVSVMIDTMPSGNKSQAHDMSLVKSWAFHTK